MKYPARSIVHKVPEGVCARDALKEIIRAWGMNPEEILTRQALSSHNAAYVDSSARENDQIRALSIALRDQMKREILDEKTPETSRQ
jgi:diphthamide synthase (EF-2-diphthine--ammonia ligase)